jgi:Flp pilus assembly protein TadD
MSLLMDVLRKTEEGRPTPQAAIELEPLAAQAGSARAGVPPDAVPAPRPIAPAAAPARSRALGATRTSWLLLGGAGLGAAFAVAGGIWFEAHATAQTYTPPPAAPAPALLPIAGDEQPAHPPEDAPPASHRAPRPAPQHPSADTRHAPIDAPDEEPLQLRPGQPAPSGASHLILSAHDAYTAGDLPHAQTQYRQVLRSEPANLDALDGLGAIALQQGLPEQAESFFRRALLLSPHDPVALAGLSQAHAPDLLRADSRLRVSLTEQPDALAPRIALGDSLASQQRWAEAQQAYFQAHALAPDDPDLAYNLAVSLDHLGQRQPAVTYYRKALELAAHHPARFARTQAEARLQTLLSQEPRP